MAVIKIPDGKGGWIKLPTVKGEPGKDGKDGTEVTKEDVESALGYTVNSDVPGDAKFTDTIVDVSNKVDKEAGKGLSTNDYTDSDKRQVEDVGAHLSSSVMDGEVHGLRVVDEKLEFYNGIEWKIASGGVPVGNVTDIKIAQAGDRGLKLSWTDPEDKKLDGETIAQWTGTRVVRKEGNYPSNSADGTLVENVATKNKYQTDGLVDTGLRAGATYYYMLFPYTDEIETIDGANRVSGVARGEQGAPSRPTLSSKTSTSITLNSVSGGEYKRDGGSWQDSPTFSGLSNYSSYTFYVRMKETDAYFASPSSGGSSFTTDKGTQSAPSAPTVSSISNSRATVSGLSGTQVRLDTGAWYDTPHTFTGLSPARQYRVYARRKETGTKLASPSSGARLFTTEKSTQSAPASPRVSSRTTDTIRLVTVSGQEYRRGSGGWQSSGVFSGLSMATNYTFYTRRAETSTQKASPSSQGATFTTNKGTQTTPPLPTLSDIDHDRVRATGVSGTEVRLGTSGFWYSVPHTFTGLREETSYRVYLRRAETSTRLASGAVSRSFTTPSSVDDHTNSPGPKNLIGGDMDAGYFGRVPASELFTGTELASEIRITEGVSENSDVDWLKFAYNGKILFKSMKSYRYRISWDDLDDRGAIYGDTTVSKNGVTYKVRVMSGANEDPTDNEHTGPVLHNTEWNRLMLPIHENAPDNWKSPDNVDSPTEDWGINLTDGDLGITSWGGSEQWCQEKVEYSPYHEIDERIVRGYRSIEGGWEAKTDRRATDPNWSPVLEVVG